MSRVPRTNFHSSELIRCLADLALLDSEDAGKAFAEQLSHWIHFTDAITLSNVHQSGLATMATSPARDTTAASAELTQLKAQVNGAIIKICNAKPGLDPSGLPEPLASAPTKIASAWLPYRRFYEAQQREMDARIHPLRGKLRACLARATPRLRKLAELDACFEHILRAREQTLLGRVPQLLGARFELLYTQHQHTDPAQWSKPDGWLTRLCKEMQTLLLAEAELRLQPALGLLEAWKNDTP